MSKPLTPALYCRLRAAAYTAVQQMRICNSLGGASDCDQWSRSAVDDVTIIDRFARWSRQALLQLTGTVIYQIN